VPFLDVRRPELLQRDRPKVRDDLLFAKLAIAFNVFGERSLLPSSQPRKHSASVTLDGLTMVPFSTLGN